MNTLLGQIHVEMQHFWSNPHWDFGISQGFRPWATDRSLDQIRLRAESFPQKGGTSNFPTLSWGNASAIALSSAQGRVPPRHLCLRGPCKISLCAAPQVLSPNSAGAAWHLVGIMSNLRRKCRPFRFALVTIPSFGGKSVADISSDRLLHPLQAQMPSRHCIPSGKDHQPQKQPALPADPVAHG